MESIVFRPRSLQTPAVSESTIRAVHRRADLVRSSLHLPPELESIRQSQVLASTQSEADETTAPYGMLPLVQFLSDNPSIIQPGLCLRSSHPVSGRGRTYEVRQYSEGTKEDVDLFNHWRPSTAHKYLAWSPGSSGGGAAVKSLINELRILTHKPLSTHPNVLRVTGVCWALSESDPDCVLPVIRTEFATLGTLKTFMCAWECPYRLKRQLLLDVAEGLAALHSCFVVHGDVKVENILMFASEDPECPFIAKISDFGFSLDIGAREPDARGYLVGYTPLWAAPEATEAMRYSEMQLTDVYSLGFVIWAVAMNGQSLFETLDELPGDPVLRYEAFRFIKEIDDIDAAAARYFLRVNGRYSPDLDVAELMELSRYTLRLNPKQRDLGSVLATLRPGRLRKPQADSTQMSGSRLPHFDSTRIYLEISTLHYRRGPLMYQVRSDLEAAARGHGNSGMLLQPAGGQGDPTFPWRIPSKSCTRSAGAAYSLFGMHFHGCNAEQSMAEAAKWLRLSAENGHTLAMALCAKLNSQLRIGIPTATEQLWLLLSAQNGSKPAMLSLKVRDPPGYSEARGIYKTRFWAFCYGLSGQFISELLAATAMSAPCQGRDPSSNFDEYDDNLLHCAAMVGSAAAVRYCLDMRRMEINAVNSRGETALFLSCKAGHSAIIDLLLSRGADPMTSNVFGENVLHWLESFEDDVVAGYATDFVRRGVDIHQVSELDESFSDPVARQYFHRHVPGTPLHRAVEAGNILLVDILLHLGADPSHGDRGLTPLCRAVRNHDVGITRQLLEHPMSKSINTMMLAKSTTETYTFLSRAIRHRDDSVLLHYARDGYNNTEDVREVLSGLVQRGAKLTGGSYDMVYNAVCCRDYAAVDFLLSHGYGNLSLQTSLSSTHPGPSIAPLALATMNGDLKMVNLLLRHGANPESSMVRFTGTEHEEVIPALHILMKDAWDPDSLAIAKMLIAAGANVNSALRHDVRENPLSKALSQSFFRMASLLVENGARIDPPTPGKFPVETGLKLLAINNILDKSMYLAYEFLMTHPQAHLPLWTVVDCETVFHSLFKATEVYRRNIDPDNIGAIFRLLRRRFPDLHTLLIRDIYGWTPLHHAVFTAQLVGVRLLLEAGCDPMDKITREPARLWNYARGAREAFGWHDFTLEESYECVEAIFEDHESHEGKSAVDMARDDVFDKIPLPVRDNPDELDEFLDRRREIKRLFGA